MMRRGLTLAGLLAVVMASAGLAQGPPEGYRVRIGGAVPPEDPLAPADGGLAGFDEADIEEAEAVPDAGPTAERARTQTPAPPAAAQAERTREKTRKRRRRAPRTRWTRADAVTPLEAARTAGRTAGEVIEFARPITFRHDSVELADDGGDALNEVVDYLQASPEIQLVLIEGHTDATGSLRYNQALSEARAVTVRRALIGAGVAPDRLVAYGYGETRPATAEQAPNRRVVFRMVEGDREVLTRRVATEWGQAALVHARGAVEVGPSPESDADDAGMAPAPRPAMPAAEPADEAGDAERPAGAMALFIAPPPSRAEADGPAGTRAPANVSPDQTDPRAAPPSGVPIWRPLAVRGQIGEGYDIRTAAASHALIRLPDLGRIWLGPQTRVRLSKLHHDRDDGKTYLALRVRQGTVRAMLNPLERGISRSLLALPGGGLELTAADFELQVDADGRGRLRVDRGRIEHSGGARTRSVFAGQVTRLGAVDEAPRAQLPPPTALAPLQGSFRRPPALTWLPVPAAAGYRVEIAADVDFDRPEVRARTNGTAFDPRVLTPGKPWYWRVRAVDADGLTGSASQIHQFRVVDVLETRPAAAGLDPPRR